MSRSLKLKANDLPKKEKKLALTNKVYLHPDDTIQLFPAATSASSLATNHLLVGDFVYTIENSDAVAKENIGLSETQRRLLSLALGEKVTVSPFHPEDSRYFLGMVTLEVDLLVKKKVDEQFNVKDIKAALSQQFLGHFLTINQKVLMEFKGLVLLLRVVELEVVDLDQIGISKDKKEKQQKSVIESLSVDIRGMFMAHTTVLLKSESLNLVGDEGEGYMSPFKFFPQKIEELDIGGLDKEFCDLFRRAFVSRLFPPSILQKFGLKHVKGMLLYGPPGCGKTLLARQIGKLLVGKEPRVVNGPELLNKFVGESEANIRELFREAELEYKQKGDNSKLHVVIFDEFDAICKQRGSRNDGTGVGDSIVNQLLSKIDGVHSLNNILIIAMTNRKDLIDEAILRPGRLEFHLEIGLPDESGRMQILKIHTTKLLQSGAVSEDVNLDRLSKLTKNFTGAEIEGVVRSAASFALYRQVDPSNLNSVTPTNIKVCWNDFVHALQEVRPAFGVSETFLKNYIRNGIISYGPNFEAILNEGKLNIEQVRNSDVTPLLSLLLEGKVGTGKTAIAVTLAMNSGFPFVKMISPDNLIAYSEYEKCNYINKVFSDAHKSPFSIVIIDDIERLLDFSPIGPRYSNMVLQCILVLLKKLPPQGRKIFILCTTSCIDILAQMQLTQNFDSVASVPSLESPSEFKKVMDTLEMFDDPSAAQNALALLKEKSIPIKKMLMISESVKRCSSKDKLGRLSQLLIQYDRLSS